ncbi:MAG TPA: hypothetical protein VE152_06745 [Acidimicrobiales bacterium]|nr:hypothetical protein [Acidimicrobiales bacterium]
MGVVLAVLAGVVVVAALVGGVLTIGMRAGDRPEDVAVMGMEAPASDLPVGWGPAVGVLVTNPGPVAAIVGLSLRQSRPLEWLWGQPMSITVPWGRHRVWSAKSAVVGVVDGGRAGRWLLPHPPDFRRGGLRVVAIVGQAGRRLRVIDRQVLAWSGPFPSPTLVDV